MELKLYLVKNRISITEFCNKIGCSRMHLNDIVNGKRNCGKTLAILIEIRTNGEVKASDLIRNRELACSP